MDVQSLTGTFIAIITGLITFQGLKYSVYQDKYKFDIDGILIGKQYYRLFSSGFLHGSWMHYGFNMLALISFALSIELFLGVPKFLFIYFCSMLGGNILALFIHRNHADYSAVGASGAISGVIASSIILFPEFEIGLILIPGGIPGWIFGLVFILVSFIGIKSQRDNIGHEAHLGGILTGIILTIFLSKATFFENLWIVLLMLIPILAFLALIVLKPEFLITRKWSSVAPQNIRFDRKSKSIDEILDKINKNGIESLTKNEKKLLDSYSSNGGK